MVLSTHYTQTCSSCLRFATLRKYPEPNPLILISPLLVNLIFWATRFEWVASKTLTICQRAKN
jgi:hypothetical protein